MVVTHNLRHNNNKPILKKSKVGEPRKKTLSYFEKKEYRDIPEEIEQLEHEKKDIELRFASQELSAARITELSKRLGEITKLIESKENRWLELSELL